jgi:hypothetical protein
MEFTRALDHPSYCSTLGEKDQIIALLGEICIMVIHLPTQYFHKVIIDLDYKYNF